jgi:Flp pilus assembly protein TadG
VQRGADRDQLPIRVLTRGERGAGLVGTVAGVGAFLGLLLFATQVLFNLYAASVVTAATYDAARVVARGGDRRDAETHARALLGEYATRVEMTWRESDNAIAVRVRAHAPSMVLPSVGGVAAFGDFDRTIHVRRECFRDETATCRP